MKKIIDAVSIIFECQGEIFSIVRQNFLKTFPGYTAFVGGKVDSCDHDNIFYNLHLLDDHSPQYMINTLVRESREELGIEIDRLIELGLIKAVDFIGRALTPSYNPYRFNTYFYRITLKKKIDFQIDQNEIKQADWITPLKLLQQWQNGQRLMVPPIRHFLEALQNDINFKTPLIFDKGHDPQINVPSLESINGLIQLMPLSNTVPPADRTNAFIIGQTLVDPSPKNDEEYKKLVNTLRPYHLKHIFLTHHHKDHHQKAPQLAKSFGLSMHMSEYTLSKCLEVYGDHYFDHLEIKVVKDSDVVTSWLNEDVLAVSIPGHDEGHLALMPVSKKWMIVGDLFQGVGTVVVGGDEGDMQKYFMTLKKVIDLAPGCVIPSHGIALGGTYILEKTLEHRLFREKQVLEMFQKGLSLEQMVEHIYFDIPSNIIKYAKANIESHLKKLKKEEKI